MPDTPSRDGYALCRQQYKTTITSPGGISLGWGSGPGLRQAMFWNRIGSLFSCYRPAVGLLELFDADDPQRPLALREKSSDWSPGIASASYRAPGLKIREQRFSDKCGLHSRLRIRNTGDTHRELLACFHGSAEQWPFFDYWKELERPQIEVAIERTLPLVTITQPHSFEGLGTISSVQRIWLELPDGALPAGGGFGNSEQDLRALWREHGPAADVRMRLGQTGARYPAGADPIVFSSPAPHYYITVRLAIAAGDELELTLHSDYHTDDEGGDLRSGHARITDQAPARECIRAIRRDWQRHLREGVPQIECSDGELERYWYYVWYVLRANRTSGGRLLTHEYSAPSKYMYWGSWIWDSYFHVLGEMWLSDPQIARGSLRSVLAMQYPNGFIQVCSGSNYRMVFHEDVDGYAAPQGSGYASYVEPQLEDYRELDHPFEAQLSYYRRSADDSAPARQPGGRERQARLLELEADALDGLLRLGNGYDGLIINLGGTAMLNSAELGRMVAMIKQALDEKLPVAIAVHGETLTRVLRTVRLDRFTSICSSLGEARLLLNARLSGAEPSAGRSTGLMIGNEKTQTPLIGAAAHELMAMRLPGTDEFMNEILEPLKAYENWLWRRRSDSEGRFVLWHGDESGWDDSVRHYPVPARPFDVQVHCLQLRDFLVKAAVKYTPQDSAYIRNIKERRDLSLAALDSYWCDNDSWHYDLDGDGSDGDEFRRRISASSMFDLVLSERRPTEHVVNALGNPRVFGTEQPVPSLAACDEAYRPHGWGWNGPVWLQVNYFTITGLLNQGEHAAAFALWEKTRGMLIRQGLPHSHELYDPHSGTGLGCPDYSWQAMINHLVIRWFAGVHDLMLIPHLPPGMDYLRISNLPTRIREVRYRRSGNKLKIDVKFRGRPQRFGLAQGSLGRITVLESGLPEDTVGWSNGRWLFSLKGEHESLKLRLETE
ncbi:hypothetical protein KDL44_07655 [bacterium]|nr:hypothetical protein [bacterium]